MASGTGRTYAANATICAKETAGFANRIPKAWLRRCSRDRKFGPTLAGLGIVMSQHIFSLVFQSEKLAG